VIARTPKLVLLTLAVSAALVGCGKNETPATDSAASTAAPAATAATEYKLDESKLPAYNAFHPSDLDTSMDACGAFGDYVNSKWLAANEIPADRTSWGAFTILDERSVAVQHQLAEQVAAVKNPAGIEKIVGDFWATGMDEAKINAQGIEPIKADLAAIDGLQDKDAIANYLRTSAAKGENVLFGFGPEADFKNSSMNLAYASQGGLGLPDRDFYLQGGRMAEIRKQYQAYIAQVLQLAGVADPAAKAQRIVALETRIAQAHATQEETNDVAKGANAWKQADLSAKAPGMDWSAFLASAGLDAQQDFIVWQPKAVAGISRLVATEPLEVWKDYLAFHALDRAAPYLPKSFADARFAFHGTTLNGTPQQSERWKRAVDDSNHAVGEAIGKLYVERHFDPATKARADEMAKNIIAAFAKRIDALEWMSPQTKARAKAKVDGLAVGMGYPDKWRDYTGLEIKRDDALGNAERAELFEYRRNIAKLGKPVDHSEWAMLPQTINAMNVPLETAWCSRPRSCSRRSSMARPTMR